MYEGVALRLERTTTEISGPLFTENTSRSDVFFLLLQKPYTPRPYT